MSRFVAIRSGVTLLTLSLFAACGDGGSEVEGATASLGCTDGTLDATVEQIELEHDGQTRSYELHVPMSYDGATPLPLVFNFHGFTSSGPAQRASTGMDDTADDNGFIVAYPNGLSNSWNGGVCCGVSGLEDVDDVDFTRAMLDDLGARGCIDLSRVYATGMSNGGFMSHRLACEASDIIAAVGPVAGVLGIPPGDCNPERPVPVIHFHGTADNIILYEGGGLVESASVVDTVELWADLNDCTDEPTVTFDEGDVTCETASECADGATVTLCTIADGGHCWPGSPCGSVGPVDLGMATTDILANDAMWALFETVTLEQPAE